MNKKYSVREGFKIIGFIKNELGRQFQFLTIKFQLSSSNVSWQKITISLKFSTSVNFDHVFTFSSNLIIGIIIIYNKNFLLAVWLKSMPSNQARVGLSPTRCKYLTGYNLGPPGEGNRKPPLWKISPRKLQWREYSQN